MEKSGTAAIGWRFPSARPSPGSVTGSPFPVDFTRVESSPSSPSLYSQTLEQRAIAPAFTLSVPMQSLFAARFGRLRYAALRSRKDR